MTGRQGGRKAFSKKLKEQLIRAHGEKCEICSDRIEGRYLQIDHRVPYAVAGDNLSEEQTLHNYMLLCRSCNRSKSWSCENCDNFLRDRNPQVCQTCYWADPDSYHHIALRRIRRLDVVWNMEEIGFFERLQNEAAKNGQAMKDYIKTLLNQSLDDL